VITLGQVTAVVCGVRLEKTRELYNLLRYYDNDSRELLFCSNTHLSRMATTTMHFGPEWMRKQPTPVPRSSQTESTATISGLNPTAPTPPASSYSASVVYGAVHSEKWSGGHPLRYSKEDMIRIYREGVKTALGPEVERWEGIVREIAVDPVGTKEMTDVEKRVSPLCCSSSWRRTHNSLYLFHTHFLRNISCFLGHSTLKCGGDNQQAIT
jgi:hypothetical protein